MFRLLVTLLAATLAGPLCAQTGSGAPDVAPAGGLKASATPLGNPSHWIDKTDYPYAAMRAEREGHTGVLLAIGADGRVSDGTVLASSGSHLLDSQSCVLLSQRALFTPAMGKDRRPGEIAVPCLSSRLQVRAA